MMVKGRSIATYPLGVAGLQIIQGMSGRGRQFGRNVFVLDVSWSMVGIKCQTLQLSTTRIIEDIPDNSYVGIVLFEDSTQLCHRVVQITNRSIRDGLIKSVPAIFGGGTNIGAGILHGLQVFKDAGVETEGAKLFLITDGGDMTGTDYVSAVLPGLKSAKIKVVCIAIGNAADPNLERLAKETGGHIYFADDTNREMIARVIEASIQEVNTSKELTESINISVVNDIIRLDETKVTKDVIIDRDIGRNTVFTVGSEDFDKISISIHSPNGHNYDSTSPEMDRNPVLKRFQMRLKETEAGIWTITMNRHSNHLISANLSVKSQRLNQKAAQMKITLREADNNIPPVIIAELRKGSDAVVGAEVTATVDKPDGTQSRLELINYNNIYCNYFTDYCGSGRYNVTVLAQNKDSNCHLMSLDLRTAVSSSVSEFERQQIAGCFKVTDSMPQRPVNDLKLEELSLSSAFNSISFDTSVGDIEVPAPRNARAIIKPKVRAVPENGGIIKEKECINNLILVIKKSINSEKISDNERNDFKRLMDEIDNQINTKGIEELKNYSKQLEEFKYKIQKHF